MKLKNAVVDARASALIIIAAMLRKTSNTNYVINKEK